MAWLTGWSYRKSIVVKRASGAVTNYQLKLLLGESSGATGEQVDCDSKCLSSFNDIRFTKADGTTLLDYWIESLSGATPNQLATIWIEFDSIGTGDTTFYMYYGNAGASAYSNGDNTFLFFDDFSTAWNNPVKWTGDTASGSVSGGILTLATGTKKLYSSAFSGDIALRSRCSLSNYNNSMIGLRISGDDTQYNVHYRESTFTNSSGWQSGITGGTYQVYSNLANGFDGYKIIDLSRIIDSGSDIAQGWKDGTQAGTGSTTKVPTGNLSAHFMSAAATGTILVDWVLIRQFVSSEPTWESFGSETPEPTTAAPTTLAPTTLAPTTLVPTTLAPTTLAPTTLAPTTLMPTTLAPTTLPVTTLVPVTTLAPTTLAFQPGVLIGGKLIINSILSGRLIQ